MNTTWRKLITNEMEKWGEGLAYVESCTLTDEEMDREFYAGYGAEKGSPFTLWTTNRVYFPVCYDGAEWCGSVPRNPCNEASEHKGGG